MVAAEAGAANDLQMIGILIVRNALNLGVDTDEY
jgi:hypothetical protein